MIDENLKLCQAAGVAMEKTKKRKASAKDKKALKDFEKFFAVPDTGLDLKRLSMKDLSEILGYDVRQITRHVSEYGAPRNSDKSFDLENFLQWFRSWKDDQVRKATGAASSGLRREKDEIEVALKKAQSQMQSLKVQEKTGELISKKASEERMKQVLIFLRIRLLEIPTFSKQVYGKGIVQTRDALTKIVHEVLERLNRAATPPASRKIGGRK